MHLRSRSLRRRSPRSRRRTTRSMPASWPRAPRSYRHNNAYYSHRELVDPVTGRRAGSPYPNARVFFGDDFNIDDRLVYNRPCADLPRPPPRGAPPSRSRRYVPPNALYSPRSNRIHGTPHPYPRREREFFGDEVLINDYVDEGRSVPLPQPQFIRPTYVGPNQRDRESGIRICTPDPYPSAIRMAYGDERPCPARRRLFQDDEADDDEEQPSPQLNHAGYVSPCRLRSPTSNRIRGTPHPFPPAHHRFFGDDYDLEDAMESARLRDLGEYCRWCPSPSRGRPCIHNRPESDDDDDDEDRRRQRPVLPQLNHPRFVSPSRLRSPTSNRIRGTPHPFPSSRRRFFGNNFNADDSDGSSDSDLSLRGRSR